MEREELRTLPLDHAWTPEALSDTFAAVMGGVAFPGGGKPGAAIVAGLCHPETKDDCEIHVLGETENTDLFELLRACRGLAKQYRLPETSPHEPFTWIGNGKHDGANKIVNRLNEEASSTFGCNYLTIQSTTMLDSPNPYLGMFSTIRGLMQPDYKRLYVHGSRADYAMDELPTNEVSDAKFGTLPLVEALAFVVDRLQDWLKYRPDPRVDRNVGPYANWNRFNRGGQAYSHS